MSSYLVTQFSCNDTWRSPELEEDPGGDLELRTPAGVIVGRFLRPEVPPVCPRHSADPTGRLCHRCVTWYTSDETGTLYSTGDAPGPLTFGEFVRNVYLRLQEGRGMTAWDSDWMPLDSVALAQPQPGTLVVDAAPGTGLGISAP